MRRTRAGIAWRQVQPRSQYTSRATYSLMMERLASKALALGSQNEKDGSSGTVIWGMAGAAATERRALDAAPGEPVAATAAKAPKAPKAERAAGRPGV